MSQFNTTPLSYTGNEFSESEKEQFRSEWGAAKEGDSSGVYTGVEKSTLNEDDNFSVKQSDGGVREVSYSNLKNEIQSDIVTPSVDLKANSANPTFTGQITAEASSLNGDVLKNTSVDFEKLSQQAVDAIKAEVSNPNGYIPQGEIAASADFPTPAAVQTGWQYIITANVTDNDPTKTNTGDSFLAGTSIVWKSGGGWMDLGVNYVTQAQKDKINLGANFVKHIDLTTAAITPFEGAVVTPDEDGIHPNYGGLERNNEVCDFVYEAGTWVKKKVFNYSDILAKNYAPYYTAFDIIGNIDLNTLVLERNRLVYDALSNSAVYGIQVNAIDKFIAGNTISISVNGSSSSGAGRVYIIPYNSVGAEITGNRISVILPTVKTFVSSSGVLPASTESFIIRAQAGVAPDTLDLDGLFINDFEISNYPPVEIRETLDDDVYAKNSTTYIASDGDDSNDGSSIENAVATMVRAKKITHDYGCITLIGGDYFDFDFDFDFKNVRGKDQENIRFIYGDRFTSATLTSGQTRVYETPYSFAVNPVKFLWQHDIEDEDTVIALSERHPLHRGRRVRLESTRMYNASSIAEIESTTDKLMWYKDDVLDILYFSKAAGSDLSVNPIVIPTSDYITAPNSIGNLKFSNISVLYKGIQTTGISGIFEDISCNFNNSSGSIEYDGVSGIEFIRCEAGGNLNDGFNGHTNVFPTDPRIKQTSVRFTDCYAHDNGDDGDSCHEYCEQTHNGGLFEYNGNGVTPASGAHSVCNNVTSQHNGDHTWTSDKTGTGFSSQGSPLDSGVGTNIHCFNCLSIGNIINFRGNDVDSKFINCVSKDAITTNYDGGQNINSVSI